MPGTQLPFYGRSSIESRWQIYSVGFFGTYFSFSPRQRYLLDPYALTYKSLLLMRDCVVLLSRGLGTVVRMQLVGT